MPAPSPPAGTSRLPGGIADGRPRGAVPGELGGPLVEVVLVQGDDGLGRRPFEPRPAAVAELGQEHLVDERMDETEAIDSISDFR